MSRETYIQTNEDNYIQPRIQCNKRVVPLVRHGLRARLLLHRTQHIPEQAAEVLEVPTQDTIQIKEKTVAKRKKKVKRLTDEEILEKCKGQRSRCTVWTRVMGYYRPIEQFNKGKQAEHRQRRMFAEPPPQTLGVITAEEREKM